jgi:hypothetical protein
VHPSYFVFSDFQGKQASHTVSWAEYSTGPSHAIKVRCPQASSAPLTRTFSSGQSSAKVRRNLAIIPCVPCSLLFTHRPFKVSGEVKGTAAYPTFRHSNVSFQKNKKRHRRCRLEGCSQGRRCDAGIEGEQTTPPLTHYSPFSPGFGNRLIAESKSLVSL